jgi:hypothetical protein
METGGPLSWVDQLSLVYIISQKNPAHIFLIYFFKSVFGAIRIFLFPNYLNVILLNYSAGNVRPVLGN